MTRDNLNTTLIALTFSLVAWSATQQVSRVDRLEVAVREGQLDRRDIHGMIDAQAARITGVETRLSALESWRLGRLAAPAPGGVTRIATPAYVRFPLWPGLPRAVAAISAL